MQATRVEQETGCWAGLGLEMEWHVRPEPASRAQNPFEIDDEAFERALTELPRVEPESPARLDELVAVEVPSLWLL